MKSIRVCGFAACAGGPPEGVRRTEVCASGAVVLRVTVPARDSPACVLGAACAREGGCAGCRIRCVGRWGRVLRAVVLGEGEVPDEYGAQMGQLAL